MSLADHHNFDPSPTLNRLTPIPSQILTLFHNDTPVNITLDTGATVSFIRLNIVTQLKIPILPNNQLALLADDKTKMASLGEIDITLTRGHISCRLRALIMKNLQADVFGGTTFHNDNDIQGRIKTRQIKIHDKYMVFQTNDILPLPAAATTTIVTDTPPPPTHSFLKTTTTTTLFPDSSINLTAPTRNPTTPTIAVFPEPPIPGIHPVICETPAPGQPLTYTNQQLKPITIPAKTTFKCLAIHTNTHNQHPPTMPSTSLPKSAPPLLTASDLHINTNILSSQQIQQIVAICNTNRPAFHSDLTGGYNHRAGKHFASLRFKSETKPEAKTLGMPAYSRKCAAMQQAAMDRLEQQGVLTHPQDHDIQVRLISPSWVIQKGSAKHKKLEDCTLDELRYVVAFNALNDHLLPQPSKPSSAIKALKFLARWKYYIFADLQNSYFQIHLAKRDWCWTGVMTPFKGVRVLTRAGQGLLNSEAELDELLERVLGPHISSGICQIARDDIQIGGNTLDQAIRHWDIVLTALCENNLKLTAKKVRFFPQETEIYGWKFHLDGSIAPSDHILTNLGHTDIGTLRTVKAVNSWRGLYKTLLPALPNLASLMDPFDKATAQLQTKGVKEFEWTPSLVAAFNAAQDHLKRTSTRVLPKPHEQLLLQPDGAQNPPCIGWCLFVLRNINNKLTPLPVQFASAKLNNYIAHWKPCEIEAVAAATAIDQCSHWIMEAEKPTFVCPDSKAVVQATERMKKGQMSTNPRLQTILACINRRPVVFYHSSAKLGQHYLSDLCSRSDTTCKTSDCAIERFLQDIPAEIQLMATSITNLILDHRPPCIISATATAVADWLNSPGTIPIGSTETWKRIQQQDDETRQVIHLIKTGDSPRRQSSSPAINRFFKQAKLEDGLLVVKSYDPKLLRETNKIIIPPSILPTVLTSIHNRSNHPTRHQMAQLINRYFFTSGLENKLDELFDQCTICMATKQFPKPNNRSTAPQPPTTPGTHMNADVIKRAGQLILVTTDLYTNYVTSTLIPTETKQALIDGLVTTTTPIRLSTNISIRTDRAPALQALAKDKFSPLTSIGINLELPRDAFNKNANCHVDRAIQLLENEIRKLSPEGQPLSPVQLAKATLNLNHRIRNNGLTAAESHFSREAATLEPIPPPPPPHPPSPKPQQPPPAHLFSPGEKVFIKSHGTKHILRQPFLVTGSSGPHLQVRKILHPYSPAPRLSHVQQNTTTSSVYPAVFTRTFSRSKPCHKIPTPPPPPTLVSDSDSEYEDTPADSFFPPPPPLHPTPPGSPIAIQRHLLDSVHQAIAATPPLASHIPPLHHLHDHYRTLALHSRRDPPHIPPKPPPPLPPDPPLPQAPPPRRAKLLAIAKINSNPIPQLEGAETSPDTSLSTAIPSRPTTPPSPPAHPLSPQEPWSPSHSFSSDSASLDWDNYQLPSQEPADVDLLFPAIPQPRRATFGGFPGPKWITRRPILPRDPSCWPARPPNWRPSQAQF